MSGSLPTTPEFRSATVASERAIVTSTSISLRTQQRNLGGHRWRLTVNYPPMTREEFAPIDAFLEQQAADSFTVIPTLIANAMGNPTGSVVTSGSAAAGAKSVTLASLSGTLKAGSFIKFATHNKVYKVTADRVGSGAVSIEPGLRVAVAGGVAVTYQSVPFTVRLVGTVREYGISTDSFVTYEFEAVEAT